ncbi:unnamed protein product, partial [Allacma fusca]
TLVSGYRKAGTMDGHLNSSYHSFHRHQNKKRKLNTLRMDTDAEDESETCSSMRTVTPTDDSSKKAMTV